MDSSTLATFWPLVMAPLSERLDVCEGECNPNIYQVWTKLKVHLDFGWEYLTAALFFLVKQKTTKYSNLLEHQSDQTPTEAECNDIAGWNFSDLRW